MIRIVLFLILIGALSVGVAWLADRPGDVVIVWQGLRIKTSLMVLAVALVTAVVVLALLLLLIVLILRSPTILARIRRGRRGVRAYEAISHGLIAIGAGDVEAAKKHAATVNRLAPHEPLALLLNAQSAQLAGDREAADRTFRAMAGRADTKPLGLHGLFIEARRNNDAVGARAYAEEAARTAPSLHWANRAVLEALCRDGNWAGALRLLENNMRSLERSAYRRTRAVLLTAQAHALEHRDRDAAKAAALEAQKLAPTLVPTAALAGRLLAESGQTRKARRVIDAAWRANPHPALAKAYAELRSGESARERLKRIETLAGKVPSHVEGALAVARAALGAQEFAKARAALAPYLEKPTKRIALLMAALERAERNDEGRAREWLARAVNAAPDPAWTADGHVSEHWQAASPVTGRLDAFEWRVPLTGAVANPAIEPDQPPAAATITADPPQETSKAPPAETLEMAAATVEMKTETKPEPKAAIKPDPPPQPIIPLIHVPDDPGPDAVPEIEPHAEHPNAGWRKIFG
ncbi:MAG TPA: heme biosynthesis HemY N-terminal domain-containing protein [Xanthobacteraceae bacterium]|jgi:HemY protein|nr:heme biosynthesis HemY N-terminal domain-containing protein [Xanthobacteraceae bacterium]